MINLRHISPSSISSFVECRAKWATRYDRDLRIEPNAPQLTKGTLVHGALEMWKDPCNRLAPTLPMLKACFAEFCKKNGAAETSEVFQAAYSVLNNAYEMTVTHDFLPLDRTRIWGVEAKIENWRALLSWPLPVLGYIDTVQVVQARTSGPNDVVLVIGDYKTGQPKTKDDLLLDIQPPIYMMFGMLELKPRLEREGWNVLNVMNVWSYLEDKLAIPLYQTDFNLELIAKYIENISYQMIVFVYDYNAACAKGEIARDKFLHKVERTNDHCNWCDIKYGCEQFSRAIRVRKEIDLYNPATPIPDILAERDLYAMAQKTGETRKKEIDKLIRLYMEQENLPFIPANGQEYFEVKRTERVIPQQIIYEIVGEEYFIENASVSLAKVEKYIATVKELDQVRADQLLSKFRAYTSTQPGARYLATRKLKDVYVK